jgi:EAL domain-containing protein (putative c-di-GMP-specific phosphodiesterase class I)/GGDEF domain-containing protein
MDNHNWIQRIFLARYEHSETVVRRKVAAFLIILSAMILANVLYFGFLLITRSPFSQDLQYLIYSFVILIFSLALFLRGQFFWAVNIAILAMLVPLSVIVYFGVTLNELKLYNMAFLHMMVIAFGILVAQKRRQIIGIGIASMTITTVFLFARLLPNAEEPVANYWASYITVFLVVFIVCLIGIQVQGLLERSLRDISESLEFDGETGLPNKNRFIIDLDKRAKSPPRAVICLRIENQQELILNLGPALKVGIIDHVSRILRDLFSREVYQLEEDILAVFGEDADLNRAKLMEVHDLRHTSIMHNGVHIQLHSRTATIPLGTGARPDDILQQGLLGLYQARKENVRDYILDREQAQRARHRLNLVHQITDGLNRNAFEVAYQPIVSREGRVLSMEILARWRDVEGNAISPEIFIPLIEDSGQMARFQHLIVTKVLNDRASWSGAFPDIKLFLNLSPQLFTEDYNVQTLLKTLADYSVPKGALGFEITESVLSSSQSDLQSALEDLHRQGWEIAMDDFGTGYTNFERILDFPFSKVKFDKSLLKNLDNDVQRQRLLDLLVSYFGNQGITTVMEGIETPQQFELLKAFGCDQFQGYYFLKPMPLGDALQYIRGNFNTESD